RVEPLAPAAPSWLDVAIRTSTAADPAVPTGDVVAVLPGSSDEVSWLFVGEVSGGGPAAADEAARMRSAAQVLAGADPAPSALLLGTDRALRGQQADRAATAVALRLRHVRDRAHVVARRPSPPGPPEIGRAHV